MNDWTAEELDRIGAAEELAIAPHRDDGTLRKPVPIWVVRVGDDLYVRSWRGRTGAWFRAAQLHRQGRVRTDGVEKDVSFVEATAPDLNDQLDAAYRTKYRRHADNYVPPMLSPAARATTLKLVLR